MPEMKLNYAKGFIGGQVQQNYDPDQPRDPKGSSTGGQWTGGGSGGLNKAIEDVQKWYKGDLSKVKIGRGETTSGAAGHVGYGEEIALSEYASDKSVTKEDDLASYRKAIARFERRLQNPDLTPKEMEWAKSQIAEYRSRIDNYIPYTVAQSQADIVKHELGHIVQFQLQDGAIDGITDLYPPSKNPIPYEDTLFAKFPEMRSSYPVSEYGSSDFDEYFAESFVLYDRKEYSKIHPDMMNLFERITR